jgi:RNA polymerase sigma factor (sigma-70 family)
VRVAALPADAVSARQPRYAVPAGFAPAGPGRPNDATVQEETISEMIEAIGARGDRDAFAALFRHFAPRLKAYAMRSGTDAAAAEEIAQEAMVQVWRRAATFDRARAGGSSWIFAIARNKRIDLARRERRPEIELEEEPTTPAADTVFDAEEDRRALVRAFENLPREQSEILRKAYLEDKSHGAIAAETGLPLGTVKSRARLGLARLRVLMAGWDP